MWLGRVVAQGLGKRYGDQCALRDVDLYAPLHRSSRWQAPDGAACVREIGLAAGCEFIGPMDWRDRARLH